MQTHSLAPEMKDAYWAGECAPHGCLAKRIGVAILGGTITLIGLAMIVLPGPAIVVIPIGLSILATEFLWARRYLRKARELATRFKEKAFKRRSTGSCD
jgi:hypothetical protein